MSRTSTPMYNRWNMHKQRRREADRPYLSYDEYAKQYNQRQENKAAEIATPTLTASDIAVQSNLGSIYDHVDDKFLRQSEGFHLYTKPGYVSLGAGSSMRTRYKGHQ